jgi:hypothetical protein
MYAIISEGAVLEYPIRNIHQRYPQTSFPEPMVDTALPEGVVRVYPAPTVSVNPDTHKVTYGDPVLANGQWVEQANVVELPQDELDLRRADRATNVRATRNRGLATSDWTQLADAPVDKQAWATYRQALRDVPAQAGFPFDVTWPTEP